MYKRGCEPEEDVHTLADRARSREPSAAGSRRPAPKKSAVATGLGDITTADHANACSDELLRVNQAR